MGTLYIAVEHAREEYIDAHDLGYGAKEAEWCLSDTAGVVLAALFGRWRSSGFVECVGDDTQPKLYAHVRAKYRNVTYEAAREYNELAQRWRMPESREELEQRREAERERQAILLGKDPAQDTD